MGPFIVGIIVADVDKVTLLTVECVLNCEAMLQLSQLEGRCGGWQPYLKEMLLSHSVLVSSVPEQQSGMVVSQALVAPVRSRHFFTFSGEHARRAWKSAPSPSQCSLGVGVLAAWIVAWCFRGVDGLVS